MCTAIFTMSLCDRPTLCVFVLLFFIDHWQWHSFIHVEALTLPDTLTLPVTCPKIFLAGQLWDSYYICINCHYCGPSSHNINYLKSFGFGLNLWQVTGKARVSGKIRASKGVIFKFYTSKCCEILKTWSSLILFIFKDTCYTWCKISSKFVNTQCIKNSRGIFFDNLSRDGKIGVKVEKRTLVAELKLKMSPVS